MQPHRWAFRSLSTAPRARKPIFFDMTHSNNAARVRLWMQLKRAGGMEELVETRTVKYPDLQTAEFAAINPLKKVPALIREDGSTVFESNVILSFLEDKYGDAGPSFKPATCEGRQEMELLCRVHDLYIASPNTTAPGFSHSQGMPTHTYTYTRYPSFTFTLALTLALAVALTLIQAPCTSPRAGTGPHAAWTCRRAPRSWVRSGGSSVG